MTIRAQHATACLVALVSASLSSLGCQSSPYYQSQGTAVGALGGAGVGALVGSASGDAGTGALIGAGVGALTGNVVGSSLDDIEARNRAQIAASMGRPVAAGSATPGEVVAMSRAGVDPQLITNYINTSGVAQPVTPQDVIYMTQQGVQPGVIQAMQMPRTAPAGTVIPASATVVAPAAGPVIVEEVYYGPPPCHPGPPCCGPHVGWGVSISN
jgi:hypothetical protein